MDDFIRVKGLNCLADLLDDEFRMLFVKWLAWLLADVVVEVTGWHEFCDDVVGHLVFKDFNELKDALAVVASHLFGYLKLFEDLFVFLVYLVNCALLNDLHCDLGSRILVLGEDDDAEGALAELGQGLVRVNPLLPEALSSEDLLMPVLQGLLRVKVDRSLLRNGRYEVDAELSCDIAASFGLPDTVNDWCVLYQALHFAECIRELLLLGTLGSAEVDSTLADAQLIGFEATALCLEVAEVVVIDVARPCAR